MSTASATSHDSLRKPITACAGLALSALLLVAIGRQDHTPPAIDPDGVKASVELVFTDAANGYVIASDAASGAEIMRFGPGEGGFVRVTMRGFAAERKARGTPNEQPFLLARLADDDLVLNDAETGRRMLLNAFGPSNEGAFARLLDRREVLP
ncbi:MAG: photosynthetic complex assembly protein PuhC [Mesorhizobium sp.]|nr:photosynthetic complex assembly protein PuhC [Mesorhizobium sp.]